MSTVGAFGKLPARGDFISLGLPAGFADPWHAWLVRGLAAARARLGEAFAAAWHTAPAWHFVLPAGAVGGVRAAGVLLPSADAVQRLFPLTLATVSADLPALSVLLAAADWFAGLEAHARAAQAPALDLPGWAAALEGLALGSPTLAFRRNGVAAARDVLADRAGVRLSVFWTDGGADRPPACLAGQGLPEGASFARLLGEAG